MILVAGEIVHWLAYYGRWGGHRWVCWQYCTWLYWFIPYLAIYPSKTQYTIPRDALVMWRSAKSRGPHAVLVLDLVTAPSAHNVRPPDS